MLNAKLSIILRYVLVLKDMLEMLSADAILNHLNLNNQWFKRTPATVFQMQNVEMVYVSVCQNFMEMVMYPADQNVFSTMTVLVTKPASETNVKTHVFLELVVKVLFVTSSIMLCLVIVHLEPQEVHLFNVNRFNMNLCTQTHVNHHLVFTDFFEIISEQPVVQEDTCNCVPNAECRDGVCVCLPEFYGDGYVSCRPECVLNNDCPSNKACIRNKCKNPCVPGTCGEGAICDVINHAVSCNCPPGTTGSPFVQCKPIQYEPVYTNPCQPSPCGPNSQCREVNKQAVCSCLPNYFGSPPACRPECTVNSDCPLNKACFNQKC
ncbi:protocadherin Fat 3-like, partial [Diaphorina citri]|uniref:Protocadherin Fat 3-like n=1 Tax=Diaphorina citri TaxID=121845 RepID=A0A3Q0IMX2_DIACI